MKTTVKKPTYKQVRDLAFALGKRDRIKLKNALDAVLEPKSVDEMDDAELEAELNRRHEEAERESSRAVAYLRHRGMKPVTEYLRALDAVLEQIRLTPKTGSPIYNGFRWL